MSALENVYQFELTVVGTQGALQEASNYQVYNKEQLLERLNELLTDKHTYSVLVAVDPKVKDL